MSSMYGWRAGTKLLKSNFISISIKLPNILARRSCTSSLSPHDKLQPTIEGKGNAFYVVRKGSLVGIYKSLNDCQAQVSSSVLDPPVSVYKGYSLLKETEECIASYGLKNALYSINSKDLKEDMFGTLVSCPFQDGIKKKLPTDKRLKDVEPKVTSCISDEQFKETFKQGQPIEEKAVCYDPMSCILEFDGASKRNPKKAGAGAILRTKDGSVISRLREGLGIATNNAAEYSALILGLKYALNKGFKQIHVQGDSQLVCMQVQGLWKTKNENLLELCQEVKKLKDMFASFSISHVKREFNSDADAEANLALDLPMGEVYEESS